MKRICSYFILASLLMMTSLTQAQIKKSSLRVLFVGGATDYQTYDYGNHTKVELACYPPVDAQFKVKI